MSSPPAGPAGDRGPPDGPGTTGRGARPGAPPPTVSRDKAPTLCGRCSQPLSVGERMFYFLEGAGTAPYCRACLARHPKTTALDPDAAREVISWDRVDAPTGRFPDDDSEDHEHLASAVRSFLGEELDRLERALDRVSYDDPDLPLARSLHQEVQHQLFSGGLPEALLMLRDLRHILTGLERTRKRAPLHAPWDEGVVELFDRVRARASAMTPPAAPTPDGEDGDGPAVLRGPRSPATLGSAGKCAAAQTRP